MRKILLFITVLFVATSVWAFGGGGKGYKSSLYHRQGVDSLGIHYNGEGQVNIKWKCPKHSEWCGTECTCESGWQMDGDVCRPTSITACEEEGMYWCDTTQTCVADAEACMALCPEDRQCGTTCCGEGHTCQEGECCDVDGNCCDATESTGYSTEDGECCELGKAPFYYWWYAEDDHGDSFCCAPNKILPKIDGYRVDYVECCDEDSVPYIGDYEMYPEDDYTYFEQYCCPKENTLTTFNGASACCEEGQTAFCSGQKADGTCEWAECLSEGDRKYPCWYDYETGYISYCGCDQGNTLTPFGKVSACCGEGETPYCSNKDEEGNCTSPGCCDGTLYPGKGWNGNTLCCWGDSKAFCSARDEDGNCTSWGCCDGDVSPNVGWNRGDMCCDKGQMGYFYFWNEYEQHRCTSCSEGQIAYCTQLNEDGSCYSASCCGNGATGYDNETLYCIVENEDGACQLGYCGPADQTPYCPAKYDNGICRWGSVCDGIIYEGKNTGGGGLCCANDQVLACNDLNDEGHCKNWYCNSPCSTGTPVCSYRDDNGDCFRYECSQAAANGTCTVMCAETINGFCKSDACCREGQTAACDRRLASGYCTSTRCVVGCQDGQKAYCASRDQWGYCKSFGCCEPENIFYNMGAYNTDICCRQGQGYCLRRDENGNCTSSGCCNGTVSCVDEDENGVCRRNQCCPSGENPYCSYRDEEGDCTAWDCAPADSLIQCAIEYDNGACYRSTHCLDRGIFKINDYPVSYTECCDEDSVPYIGDYEFYDEDDTYFEQYCCPKENTLTNFNGASACCEEGQIAFCSGQTANGICMFADCLNEDDQKYPCRYDYESHYTNYCSCNKDNTITPFDNVAVCCEGNKVPYCSWRDNNGNCTSGSCCSGIIHSGKGNNGADKCCDEGTELYCSSRTADGNCTGWGCCNGTPFNNATIADRCAYCSDGQTPYCAARDADGNCTSTSCCNGTIFTNTARADLCASYSNAVPYCAVREANGDCSSADGCHPNGRVWYNKVRSDLCGYDGGVPIYCSERDENGDCTQWTGCTGIISEGVGANGTDVCNCPEGKAIWCSQPSASSCRRYECCAGTLSCYDRDTMGNCTGTTCCRGTVFSNIGYNGADVCCNPGQMGYRTSLYGTCTNCATEETAICLAREQNSDVCSWGFCCPAGDIVAPNPIYNNTDVCYASEMGCKTNEECAHLNTDQTKYFCHLRGSDINKMRITSGTCEEVGSGMTTNISGLGNVILSDDGMSGWGAYNWCKVQGMHLITVEELKCYKSGTNDQMVAEEGLLENRICCKGNGVECDYLYKYWGGDKEKVNHDYSHVLVQLREMIEGYIWTASNLQAGDPRRAYMLGTTYGTLENGTRNAGEYTHALCVGD